MMRAPDCFFDAAAASAGDGGGPVHRLHVARPGSVEGLADRLEPAQRDYLRFMGFTGKAGSLALLPASGADGLMDAVLGLGADEGHAPFGALPFGLPADTRWRPAAPEIDPIQAMLGFGLGAYRFEELKRAARRPARLAQPDGAAATLAAIRAIWMGRDLINRPANLLGPAELADAVVALGEASGAATAVVADDALAEAYPAIAAVGRGSARGPRVATLRWQGSGAAAGAPLVSLCGKGICFDSGGYDLKPSAGMLRMKKDMGGAAAMMALAAMVMAEDLPVRLVLRVGCAENSVSGRAMRPLDVIRTRSGKTVEIGNTDAEGRLVLCDLLHEAAAEDPAVLIDAATLTGAARTALGPDLPAVFCSDPASAAAVVAAGRAVHDPVWELPLWSNYDSWLDSNVADLNNVSSKSFAGAIVAALFLKHFAAGARNWMHFDIYAWNDQSRPAAPEGGEIQTARALLTLLRRQFGNAKVS